MMNDNEIIQVFKEKVDFLASVTSVYLDENEGLALYQAAHSALDLINRQQAEIERLQNLTEKDFKHTAISTVERHRKWIEYRAIKEFAKKIRQKISAMVCSPEQRSRRDCS